MNRRISSSIPNLVALAQNLPSTLTFSESRTHWMDGKPPNSALGNIHASASPFQALGASWWFATPHHARGSRLGNAMYQCKRKRAASTHRRGERRGK